MADRLRILVANRVYVGSSAVAGLALGGLLSEPGPRKAHSCFPRVSGHLTLLYRPG